MKSKLPFLPESPTNEDIRRAVPELIEYLRERDEPSPASPAFGDRGFVSSSAPKQDVQPPAQNVLREWAPIGEGEKFWRNPQGFSTPKSQVPDTVLQDWEQSR